MTRPRRLPGPPPSGNYDTCNTSTLEASLAEVLLTALKVPGLPSSGPDRATTPVVPRPEMSAISQSTLYARTTG